ncbi:DUF2306 domain-containing protein [Nonomuraea sp. NBC_01738]|uniref:DUF2306 domain-containing protein n=1 Tax=Nonomuraea sp. NBC_01738 TaxID=2976003 RepID=UPI002E15D06A|nr:DUF2306 domain-containing protein [Nonomuraea sp. NBC_01738]
MTTRTPTRRTGTRWWRRPWIAPAAVVALVFLAFSLPNYVTFDPALSRVPAPDFFPPHFPLLALHVIFGSIAMTTCLMQIWPWLRARNPRLHRLTGRVYVLAGVLPAGLLGLVVGAATPFGHVARASNVLLALLWLGCTLAGWRMARRRRYREHRRWMVRSFALTMSIISNRLWSVLIVVLVPVETLGSGQREIMATVSGLSTWLGWVIPLLVAEWWLEHRPARRTSRPDRTGHPDHAGRTGRPAVAPDGSAVPGEGPRGVEDARAARASE